MFWKNQAKRQQADMRRLWAERSSPNLLKDFEERYPEPEDQKLQMDLEKLQIERRKLYWDKFKSLVQAAGLGAIGAAAIGLFLTYQQNQANYQQNNERLITDRYAKAVEQLGSQNISVRIGAIYSLERIAKDSPKDHSTIMEVLTAFVRERSPLVT